MHYNEPAAAKTVNNYYKEKSKNNFRIREFNTTDSIKLSKDIETFVGVQMEANETIKRDNLSLHLGSGAVRYANVEYKLDNLHRNLVEFYLTKGQKANPSDFTVKELNRPDKARLSYNDLLDKALSETESAIQIEKDLARNKRNGKYMVLENQWERHQSNNEYMNNDCYAFKTRRDYPIDSLLLTRDQNHMAYFSIYKNGVVEGYKERQQLLGEIDSSINLPLAESRSELIKKIASKLTSGEYTSYKHTYGVSINRLTFEFFEVIRTNSEYFGIHGSSSSYFDRIIDVHQDFELYSIIDMKNDSVKLPAVFANGE